MAAYDIEDSVKRPMNKLNDLTIGGPAVEG